MERRIGRLGDFILIMLVVLTLRIVYWQLVRGESLQPMAPPAITSGPLSWLLEPLLGIPPGPYTKPSLGGSEVGGTGESELNQQVISILSNSGVPVNLEELPQPVVQRTRDLLAKITRGTIYDRSGRPLAYDDETDPQAKTRRYNEASLGQLVGYVSGLRIGIAGLEGRYNAYLFGLHRLDAQISRMLRAPIRGSDLVLTIDTPLQQATVQALQGRRGSIVILDGSSGAVLAMASEPGFDPNRMLDPAYTASLDVECSGDDCPAPLLNRATQGRYVPGSTWKTVTLIAGLDSGQLKPGMVFDFGKAINGPNGPYYVYRVDGGTIPDPNHRENRLTLEMSYAKSANAAFARIGDEMPAQTLIEYANRLGMSEASAENFPFDTPSLAPQLANDLDTLTSNNLLRASTAIGQGELLETPLGMARVVLAVVNNGNLPLPYLVDAVRDPNGQVTNGPIKGRVLNGLFRPDTAAQVKRMMQIVVKEGSGVRAQVRGLTVGGKTGTAQLANGAPHAWFAGFAEDGQRSIVMVVMVEHGGEGSQTAAPIFASLAPQALQAARQAIQAPPTPPPPATQPPAAPQANATPAPDQNQNPVPTQPGQPAPAPTQAPAASNVAPPPIEPDILYKPDSTPFYIENGPSCPLRGEPIASTGRFNWPSNYQYLSGGEFRDGHPGLDLGAPDGSPVYAADSGMVVFAGWTGTGYGNTVVIDHGNGFWTLYAHLSQVSIPCGTPVKQGQRVAMSGSTGNSSGQHLHFEVRVSTGYVNPVRVLPVP